MQSTKASAPSCDIDFYSDQTIAEPAAAYAHMHILGPLIWLARNELHAIVGFAELTKALRNHRCFQSGKGVSINESVNKLLVGSTLNSDPTEHDESRAITSPVEKMH